jgi:hypothetical protein
MDPGIVVVNMLAALGLLFLRGMGRNQCNDVQPVVDLLAQTEAQGWHFVALRYQLGRINRIYAVFVTRNAVVGARVRDGSIAFAWPTHVPRRADDPWLNPAFYPSRSLLERYVEVDLESDVVLAMDAANFRLPKSQITDVAFERRDTWRPGSVPESGRILVTRAGERPLELALVGTQDGPAIAERLRREILSSQSHAAYR